jgi:hypothetical protein
MDQTVWGKYYCRLSSLPRYHTWQRRILPHASISEAYKLNTLLEYQQHFLLHYSVYSSRCDLLLKMG